MKIFVVVITILLLVIDWIVFLCLCKALKKYSDGNELKVPVKKIIPYIIIMIIASALIPVINIWGA